MVTPFNRFFLLFLLTGAAALAAPELRIGILGTDSSHSVELSKLFNVPSNPDHVPGARIVAAWKGGSPDVEKSASRVEGFAAELRRTYGVRFYSSIEEMMPQVDAVLILSVDARPHLDEARRVFAFHKPVFIDKPMAADLGDAIAIFRLARRARIPCFSASGERFTPDIVRLKGADIGRQQGVFVYGPCPTEPHHPDFYWYGIHAVEKCYTLMGPGCLTVARTHTADTDVITGVWSGGRVGTVWGTRSADHGFDTIEFGSKAIMGAVPPLTYRPLAVQMVKFFRTGVAPVPPAETIEILAFMTAADESKRRGGAPVPLAEVLQASGGTDGI